MNLGEKLVLHNGVPKTGKFLYQKIPLRNNIFVTEVIRCSKTKQCIAELVRMRL